MRRVLFALAIVCACAGSAAAAEAPAVDVPPYVTELLSAYANKDVAGVTRLLDARATMYGDAASEVFTTPAEIEGLLASDYRQWSSAHFGRPLHVSIESSRDLESVFFDAPFTFVTSDANTMTVTVRFATVWHRVHDRYLLLQSSNATVR